MTHMTFRSKRSVSHHSVLVCFPHRSLCARFDSLWLLSLGVCLCRVHPCALLAHLAVMVTPRTHCHFMMQARALRVPEFCDDHTPPSCLVTNSLTKPRYRSVNTLVLPGPWLTQGGPVTFPVCALCQLFVRSCDLAHHGLYCSHVYVCTHFTAPCRTCIFGVCLCCLPVLTWTNLSACGCLLAPLSGITLTTRAIRSQHYVLSNSYKLVRPPVSGADVSLHTRVTWCSAQVTFCQLRSLRLPRSSPLLHFWSVASLLILSWPSR